MNLRGYQADLVERIAASFNAGARSLVMQLGTGGGKTATASALLTRATSRGMRSLFLAHLDTLITDTGERLRAAGQHAGYVQAGRDADPMAPVQVASLQTLHVRGERPPASLIIIDECHRALSASVRGILDAYPSARVLGLTATPQRGDGQPLGEVFEDMHCGPENVWLTAQGYLVPCDLLAPDAVNYEALVADPVLSYARHTPGTRAIVFASSALHAHQLAAEYAAAGFPAAVMLGDTPREERARLRRDVTDGRVLVLVGVGVFVEGFDLPAIETVVLARLFTVTGSFLQAIGRGLRPCPATGKRRCTVIDLRGSVYLHGLPDEPRVWSITGKACRRAELSVQLRRCTECLAVFRAARTCVRCGARAKQIERVQRVLSRAERLSSFSSLTPAQRDAKYLARLMHVARTRIRLPEAHAEVWARGQFVKQFGREPGVAA